MNVVNKKKEGKRVSLPVVMALLIGMGLLTLSGDISALISVEHTVTFDGNMSLISGEYDSCTYLLTDSDGGFVCSKGEVGNASDTNETGRMDNIAGSSCGGTDKVSSFGADGTPVCTSDQTSGVVWDSNIAWLNNSQVFSSVNNFTGRLVVANNISCSALETDADGVVICGTDDTGGAFVGWDSNIVFSNDTLLNITYWKYDDNSSLVNLINANSIASWDANIAFKNESSVVFSGNITVESNLTLAHDSARHDIYNNGSCTIINEALFACD